MTYSTVLRRLGRWRRSLEAMGWRERRAVAAAVVLNPVIRRRLRREGAKATAAFVHRHSEERLRRLERPLDDALVARAKRLGAAVNRAAAEPAPAVTCLARSFTALLLLRREGTPAELCIGVRPRSVDDPPDIAPPGERMLFHAWVEVGGIPVNDVLDVAERHAVFPLDGLESFLGR